MIKQQATFQSAEHVSKLGNYQTTPNTNNGVSYQPITYTSLNSIQNHLYHRALYGLSVFSQEEIMTMNKEKRKRILKVHKKTKKILNTMKQEIVVAMSNNFFANIFPKSPITKDLLEKWGNDTDPELKCNISFKDLKISKQTVIL
jgi:hypothetical protein